MCNKLMSFAILKNKGFKNMICIFSPLKPVCAILKNWPLSLLSSLAQDS